MSQAAAAAQWSMEPVSPEALYPRLKGISIFSHLEAGNFSCLDSLDLVHAETGAAIEPVGDLARCFWVLLEGEIQIVKQASAGQVPMLLITMPAGETFGEFPLLAGARPMVQAKATKPSTLVRFSEEKFWKMMSSCPQVREAVIKNMNKRLDRYQAQELHREKLAALGSLAAGLMHELNNPGAAARRAASQLRENIMRLQQTSLRMTRMEMTSEQLACVIAMQEQVFSLRCCKPMSSLDQADAEESLSAWLEEAGVENAGALAPALVATGLDQDLLKCAHGVFLGGTFSDVLNWLGALVLSVQLVSTVEESITRVSDLVMAVKRYSYEGKGGQQSVDVHESLQSTLVILGHKAKGKQLTVRKDFAAGVPPVETAGSGLNQVWTNLLDNAIDAAPERSEILVHTWAEDGRVFVAIRDQGPGIPPEVQSQIFEPFFTTKPEGQGTGLGLEIVHRIVVEQMEGEVRVASQPGSTEFTVVLPVHRVMCKV